MLNRVVCRKCIDRRRMSIRDGEQVRSGWGGRDEDRWLNGWVWCPGDNLRDRAGYLALGDLREDCPYIVEHVVSGKERC